MTDPVESINHTRYRWLWSSCDWATKPAIESPARRSLDVPVADADDLTKVRVDLDLVRGPDALEDLSLPVKRAEEFVANNSLGQPHVGPLLYWGRRSYRAGQYEQAAERLEESIAAYPSDPPPGYDVINFQRLFLAMTKWQLGQHDEARRLLAETRPAVDKELQSPSTVWNYRASAGSAPPRGGSADRTEGGR